MSPVRIMGWTLAFLCVIAVMGFSVTFGHAP